MYLKFWPFTEICLKPKTQSELVSQAGSTYTWNLQWLSEVCSGFPGSECDHIPALAAKELGLRERVKMRNITYDVSVFKSAVYKRKH
jgi:hypothetical protein